MKNFILPIVSFFLIALMYPAFLSAQTSPAHSREVGEVKLHRCTIERLND